MSVRLSCPSCNTAFTLPQLPGDRRAACPRCGDVFPVRSFTEEKTGDNAAVDAPASPSPTSGTSRRAQARWSLQRSVAIVLVMGLAGLLVGVAVYYIRGGFRSKPGPQPEPPPAVA